MKRLLLIGLLGFTSTVSTRPVSGQEFLLGAQGGVKDSEGALRYFTPELAEKLKRVEKLNRALFGAANAGDLEKVKALLVEGANPSHQHTPPDDFRYEPGTFTYVTSVLHNAAPNCVATLIAAGADIRAKNNDGSEIQSVFADRLNQAVRGCREGNHFYDKSKCEAQKEALKLFLQRDDFPSGLTEEEVITEAKKVKAVSDDAERIKIIRQVITEIFSPAVVEAVYGEEV